MGGGEIVRGNWGEREGGYGGDYGLGWLGFE